MGILDDLKNQSENLKADEDRERQRQAALLKHYEKDIHPKMLKLYTFLNEFIEHLNYLNKVIQVSYPIAPDGSHCEFEQSEYKVTIDSTTAVKDMNLSFTCKLKEPLVFELENSERILSYTDVLHSYRIDFNRYDNKDNNYDLISAKFKIKGPVKVNIIFQADIENSSINLLISNFEKAGHSKHVFKERHITDEFIDGLGKYILHENANFLKLDIDEQNKEKIRKNIQADLEKRKLELEEAERLVKLEEEKEKEKKSWKNIFKKID
ncbi:MAG: hypothetical protein KAT06_07660 [Gammaproteobacteria bacterium]|nr:hypothetical protein [Gammaproteobacteria bacterium]